MIQHRKTTWWLRAFFKNDVARNVGFTKLPDIMLLEPLVLQHLRRNVTQTTGFTIFPNIILLSPLVYNMFKNNDATNDRFYNMFENNGA